MFLKNYRLFAVERTVFETHIPDNNGLSLFFCVAFPFGRFFDGLAKRALVLCEIAGLFAMRSAIFGNISPIMTVFCCFPAPATTGTLHSLPSRKVFGRLRRPTGSPAILSRFPSRPSAFPGSWMIRLKKRRKRRRADGFFRAPSSQAAASQGRSVETASPGKAPRSRCFAQAAPFFPSERYALSLPPSPHESAFGVFSAAGPVGFSPQRTGKTSKTRFSFQIDFSVPASSHTS